MRRQCGLAFLAASVFAVRASSAIPGDFDGDGAVGPGDFAALVQCLTGPDGDPGTVCAVFDGDGDGDVDVGDLSAWAPRFGSLDCGITAAASSAEGSGTLYDPWNAVDGLQSTRWSSVFADNEWIQLDFPVARHFNGLTIHWETAYASTYGVIVSPDGSTWTNVYLTTVGDGGVDEIALPPQTARHLRIHCAKRATEWGNSIWEIELWSTDRCAIDDRPYDVRVEELLAAMTPEEKTSLVHGETAMSLRAIPRLAVPALQLADGPLGIRAGMPATAFPAPIALAATWDPDLAWRFGDAMGQEFRNKGRQVWLGPAMNIIRVPQCGRNFEYYSEDPYLAARMAVAAIQGAQAQSVVACPKHYACNNQEQDRTTVNVQVGERTLREIYLPAFEASIVEGGAWSIMAAYNQVNGSYCTASGHLLTDILKNDWGFAGFAVSDWGAVHETVAPALAGLDLEMDAASPVGAYWGNGQLLAAVQSEQVSEAVVDDKVRRILRAILATGVMDAPWDSPNEEIVAHRALVREIAGAGTVLLKNDNNVLPLQKCTTQTIAVLGPRYAEAQHGGGGSSYVTPYYTISPLAGLRDVACPNVTFVDAPGVPPDDNWSAVQTSFLTPPSGVGHGLRGEYFNNPHLTGAPAATQIDATVDFWWGSGAPASGVGTDQFSVRWTGWLTVPYTAEWDLGMATDDGCRVYLDGELLIDSWHDQGLRLVRKSPLLVAGHPYALVLEYYENWGDAAAFLVCEDNSAELNAAVNLAASAAAALVFVGTTSADESEGFDRPSIDLRYAEERLIREVAVVNPHTAVIIVSGSQVGFETWLDDAPAIIQAWYGGQEAGHAIADVVFGDVNPSAKLPMTFVRRWEDHPAYGLYPGGAYTDGLDVGYRYFDQATVAPAFPFGHGLSYTTFAYSGLLLDASHLAVDGGVTVSFMVQNTGARAGSEAAQVYVRDVAASVSRPPKELKGFAKVALGPGEQRTVNVTLDRRAFALYDTVSGGWVVEPGEFQILVGRSAADTALSGTFVYP